MERGRGWGKKLNSFITNLQKTMKKFLRTLVIIIVLAWVYLLIKRNTTRFELTPMNDIVSLTRQITPSIDLTTGIELTKNNENSVKIGEKTSSTTFTTNQWYLTQVYSIWGKKYLKIDYVEFWAMGDGWADDIINNNPLIRTFEIVNTAVFTLLKYNTDWWQEPQNIQRSEFQTRGNNTWQAINPDINNQIYYGCWKTSLVEITHDDQNVYKVTETYRP